MLKINAKIIADSVNAHTGKRLTTMQLCYPRFVHSEFLTHRVFSRNAMSSRAVPVAKMIEQVRNDPAMPIHFGKNQPGMQANEELTGQALEDVQDAWTRAANLAANIAEEMMNTGAHKQVVNRILEPFQWMHVIVTATEWDNFFELRDHDDAEPNIRELAVCMKRAGGYSSAVPRRQRAGESWMDSEASWHLPYITEEERAGSHDHPLMLAQLSAARCARVSYLTHDGKTPSIEKDLDLYDRLVGSCPMHASPIEHQGCAAKDQDDRCGGNLVGWVQLRKLVERSMI